MFLTVEFCLLAKSCCFHYPLSPRVPITPCWEPGRIKQKDYCLYNCNPKIALKLNIHRLDELAKMCKSVYTPSRFMLRKPEISTGLTSNLARMQTWPYLRSYYISKTSNYRWVSLWNLKNFLILTYPCFQFLVFKSESYIIHCFKNTNHCSSDITVDYWFKISSLFFSEPVTIHNSQLFEKRCLSRAARS